MTTVVVLPPIGFVAPSSLAISGTWPRAPSSRSWRVSGRSSSTMLSTVTKASISGKMLKNDQYDTVEARRPPPCSPKRLNVATGRATTRWRCWNLSRLPSSFFIPPRLVSSLR